MKNFVKKTGAFIGLFILAAIITGIDARAGAAFAVAVIAVAGWATFKPIPRIGLQSRAYSAAVAVVIGLFPLTMATGAIKTQDPAYMAALKASDPEEYLSKLRLNDPAKWLTELEQMNPAEFAAEQARAAAAAAEAQRLVATTQAEKEKAEAEAARLAADATRLATEAAAVKAAADAEILRTRDMGYIRDAIKFFQWPRAKGLMEQLALQGGDLTAFRAEVEAEVLAIVEPLPADDLKSNRDGYALLAAIQPDNTTYPAKAADYAQRIESQRTAAVSRMRTKEDKVEGITWYQHPNQPKYTNSRSTAFFYIGRQQQGRPWLRMTVQYAANDWLFVENVVAWHDGIKEPLISGRFEGDHNSSIWEWRDVAPDAYQIEVLRSLANAKDAVLRFEGQQYKRDVTLSAGDKKAILETLLAFDVMNGGG